jgi:hypothetical protein
LLLICTVLVFVFTGFSIGTVLVIYFLSYITIIVNLYGICLWKKKKKKNLFLVFVLTAYINIYFFILVKIYIYIYIYIFFFLLLAFVFTGVFNL